tara:strand:+ start:1188 stop:1361 length:174 start_codon:yes stop_codon:yes gene_type:complete
LQLNESEEENLIDIARLARDGRAYAIENRDSLGVDFFQYILDNALRMVTIPGQEDLK